MSNNRVMLAKSAMPNNIKRNSLAQEVIRRLRNTKRDLPWSVKAEILTEFSHSLMSSGYSEKFRLDIIQAGVIGFENNVRLLTKEALLYTDQEHTTGKKGRKRNY